MTRIRLSCFGIVLLLVLTAPAWAAGEGANAYAQGEALLRQGQVEQAAQSFLMAARAEPRNQAYVDRAMTLRRIVGLRRYVASNQPSDRWTKAVTSLHLFYVQNDMPQVALAQAQMAHQKLQNATTAGMVAECHLALGQNVEAANLLGTYSASSLDLALLHGIALARLGHADAARTIAGKPLPAEATPGTLYDAARVRALLGESDQALAYLKSAFEKTPAQALGAVKVQAGKNPDFASLAQLPAFAQVLQTESKVKQTCSGGNDCGSCPLKGRCGSR